MRHVVLLDLATGEARILVEEAYNPRWSDTGHLLFTRQDTLLAAPFDPSVSLEVGGPVAISRGLRSGEATGGAFELAATGSLAYLPGGVTGQNRELAYLDGDRLESWPGERRAYVRDLEASPDGKHVSVTILNPNGLWEIWVSEIERPGLRRLVAEPGRDCNQAVWSHDSTRLAYLIEGQEDDGGVHVRSLDGSEPPRMAVSRADLGRNIHATSFSADGRYLLVDRHASEGDRIVTIDLHDPEAEPRTLVDGAGQGAVSWNGQWLAYTSDATGRREVYLRRLGPDLDLGPEFPVTTVGAGGPAWLKEAGALRLSYSHQNERHVVTVGTGSRITISEPENITPASEIRSRLRSSTWLPDGRRLVLLEGLDEAPADRIHVVLNWTQELAARMGSR
jgi:hypothetical protein